MFVAIVNNINVCSNMFVVNVCSNMLIAIVNNINVYIFANNNIGSINDNKFNKQNVLFLLVSLIN